MEMAARSTLPMDAAAETAEGGASDAGVRELVIPERRAEATRGSYPGQAHRPRASLDIAPALGKMRARSAPMLKVFQLVERLMASTVSVTPCW